jgi:hypothetical protein
MGRVLALESVSYGKFSAMEEEVASVVYDIQHSIVCDSDCVVHLDIRGWWRVKSSGSCEEHCERRNGRDQSIISILGIHSLHLLGCNFLRKCDCIGDASRITISCKVCSLTMLLFDSHPQGFPYRSQTSKESLRKISKVMAFWSLSRIVWGASMLAIYIHDVDLLRPSQGGWIPMAFLLQLIFCEIAPIIVLMDYSFMTIFDFGSSREMPSLASRQHDMAMNERRSWNVEESPRRSDDASSEAEEPLLNRSIS